MWWTQRVFSDATAKQWAQIAPPSVWSDGKFVLAAVKRNGNAFVYVDKTADMWKDKAFVLRMVKMRGMSLEYASNNLKDNKDVVLAAAYEDGRALRFANKDFTRDAEVARAAFCSTGLAFELD